MSLFRCTNCGQTFEAARPACQACGIDPATDPRAVGVVHKLETIHYDAPHPRIRGKGVGHLACDPRKAVAGSRATGEPSVVNCKACRDSAAWKANYDGGDVEIAEGQDEPVQAPAPGG